MELYLEPVDVVMLTTRVVDSFAGDSMLKAILYRARVLVRAPFFPPWQKRRRHSLSDSLFLGGAVGVGAVPRGILCALAYGICRRLPSVWLGMPDAILNRDPNTPHQQQGIKVTCSFSPPAMPLMLLDKIRFRQGTGLLN